MLDKSIPHFNVIMKRESGVPAHEIELPIGFDFCSFTPGDGKYWAEIETSVGEFANEKESAEYFKKNYQSQEREVYRRVFFLQDGKKKIGTISAWWNMTDTRKDPSIHWVAIKPEYQGRGLGRPLINYGIKKCIDIDGDKDIFIHTQTWSYKAIYLYRKECFKITEKESFGEYKNEFDQALPILQKMIRGFQINEYCQGRDVF
jgi:ribosomal protein S18 acetylase RimI-like enzyme